VQKKTELFSDVGIKFHVKTYWRN